MKSLKKTFAELETVNSLNEFLITDPYYVRGTMSGIVLKVTSLTSHGNVNHDSYWIPVTAEGCPTNQDQLIVFCGVKPAMYPRAKRLDFYVDRNNEVITKDEFMELQMSAKEDDRIRCEANELNRLRSSVYRMEKQLGLFDAMLDLDREVCGYDCIHGVQISKRMRETIAEYCCA